MCFESRRSQRILFDNYTMNGVGENVFIKISTKTLKCNVITNDQYNTVEAKSLKFVEKNKSKPTMFN